MIYYFIIEDLLNLYLQKNFHRLGKCPHLTLPYYHGIKLKADGKQLFGYNLYQFAFDKYYIEISD